MDKTKSEAPILASLAYVPVLFVVAVLMKGKDDFHMFHAKNGLAMTILFIIPVITGAFISVWLGNIFYLIWAALAFFAAYQAWSGNKWIIPGVTIWAQKFPIDSLSQNAQAVNPTELNGSPSVDTTVQGTDTNPNVEGLQSQNPTPASSAPSTSAETEHTQVSTNTPTQMGVNAEAEPLKVENVQTVQPTVIPGAVAETSAPSTQAPSQTIQEPTEASNSVEDIQIKPVQPDAPSISPNTLSAQSSEIQIKPVQSSNDNTSTNPPSENPGATPNTL